MYPGAAPTYVSPPFQDPGPDPTPVDPVDPPEQPPSPPPYPPPGDPSWPTPGYEFSGSTISALQSFIDGKPDGATIGLVASSTITGGASDQLHLSGRNNITIIGRGATIRRTAAGTTAIVQIDGGGSNIRIDGLTIDGSKSTALGKWSVTYEHEHGILVGGIQNFEAYRVTVRDVGGDGLNLQGGANKWSDTVRFHAGTFYNCGRMGVAITDGASNVSIDHNDFSQIGYYCWDIEPNGAIVAGRAAGALNASFNDNTIGTKPYGDYPTDGSQALGYLLGITGASGTGPAKVINVLRNTMTGGAMRVGVFNNGVDVEDFTMTGNTSSSNFVATGDISKCVAVSGCVNVRVTGNTQPCTVDADFVSTSGSSGTIVTTPNTV